jgi:hypothetical protein
MKKCIWRQMVSEEKVTHEVVLRYNEAANGMGLCRGSLREPRDKDDETRPQSRVECFDASADAILVLSSPPITRPYENQGKVFEKTAGEITERAMNESKAREKAREPNNDIYVQDDVSFTEAIEARGTPHSDRGHSCT